MSILNKSFFILSLYIFVFPFAILNAQEPSSLIVNYRTDAFVLLVRTLPPKPIVGTSYFKIELLDPENYSPISAAKIKIITSKVNHADEKFQILAIKERDQSKYYHANVTFESAGDWDLNFLVDINGVEYPSIGSEIFISAKQMTNTNFGNYVFFGVLLFIMSALLVLYKFSKNTKDDN